MADRDVSRRLNSPPLQGRGRGWGLSANALDTIADHANSMRRNPTEPERRLWAQLRASQLDGLKFRRQSAIGPYIADFHCPAAGLVVEVDGDTHDDAGRDVDRDTHLAAMGLLVLHVTNADVMTNIDGVLEAIRLSARRWGGEERPHSNPSPEGEGLVVSPYSG